MRVLKGLMTLTAIMGIATSAQAAFTAHWVTINPEDIKGIAVRSSSSGLVTFTDKTGCGGAEIRVLTTDPTHNRAFTLFTTAHTTGQLLFIWADSCNADGSANAGTINMY